MRHHAFTLVELLTVIGIIGLLAAVLFPIVSQVRATAQRTACTSQLRQVGTALLVYASDYDSTLPLNAHAGRQATWTTSLLAYGLTPALRICPSDPRQAERRASGGTSYVLNEHLTKLDHPRVLAETFLLVEQGPEGREDHIHNRAWRQDPKGLWAAMEQDLGLGRHRSGVLGLCSDGHLAALEESRLRICAAQGVDCLEPEKD